MFRLSLGWNQVTFFGLASTVPLHSLSVAKELIEILKHLGSVLKNFIEYLISEPFVAFFLGFILMSIVITEVFSRGENAPFSVRASVIIALALATYGASVVAEKLPLMGRLAAYAIVIGIPLALIIRLFMNKP